MKKNFDVKYWKMLWLGLVVWLASMLISAIMEWMGMPLESQGVLMRSGKTMFQQMPVFTLLLLCLLQPVLEEFAFRLWGVGKLWMIIVCLCLMATFCVAELQLWGLLPVAVFVAAWILVKDENKRIWALTLISSAGFALCHISGYGEPSWGMFVGLMNIFGMAIVLCWLAVNVNFWCAAALHALNNSIAILVPMLFPPADASVERFVNHGEGSTQVVKTFISPVHPFSDGEYEAYAKISLLYDTSLVTDSICLMGEPEELAKTLCQLQPMVDIWTFFDWVPQGENIEDRIVYTVTYSSPQHPDMKSLLHDYCEALQTYRKGKRLTFDTASVMAKEAWIVYPDGREKRLSGYEDEEYTMAMTFISLGITGEHYKEEYIEKYSPDGTCLSQIIYLPQDNPLAKRMRSYGRIFNKVAGFRVEMRDARKVTLITVK